MCSLLWRQFLVRQHVVRYKCKTYSSYIGNSKLEQSFFLPFPVDLGFVSPYRYSVGAVFEYFILSLLPHCRIYGLVKKVQASVPALPNRRSGAQLRAAVSDLELEVI